MLAYSWRCTIYCISYTYPRYMKDVLVYALPSDSPPYVYSIDVHKNNGHQP